MQYSIKLTFLLLFSFCVSILSSQSQHSYLYEPSFEHPYGILNPEAPAETMDFAPLIGEHQCISISKGADQQWAEPVDMTWKFKYIMNGLGVQDETLKSDGKHAGSIRQFIPDSNRWYVHYYNSGAPSTSLPTWEGNTTSENSIVLYREQKAPNGMDGFYRLTFYDMSRDSFKWIGEWVTPDESFTFPTWKIDCKKSGFDDNEVDTNQILKNIKAFSKAYMNADYNAVANAYTSDGKIFPGGASIIEGTAAIKDRWTIKNGSTILNHEINPSEIKFLGDYAYDYGYYNGSSKFADGSISNWKGKYVIVWKKVEGDWKMYLDIWNRVQ